MTDRPTLPGRHLRFEPDAPLDASALLRAALAAHGGRGGGSAQMAQGRVADVESLDRVVNEIGEG